MEAATTNHAGTDHYLQIHYVVDDEAAYSCEIEGGIAKGEEGCCTLKLGAYTVKNMAHYCGDSEAAFMRLSSHDDMDVTRIAMYRPDGDRYDSTSSFGCFDLSSCSGYDSDDASYARFKIGKDSERNVRWGGTAADNLTQEVDDYNTTNCFDNRAISWKSEFSGYDYTVGTGNDLFYYLPDPTTSYSNGYHSDMQAYASAPAIFYGEATGDSDSRAGMQVIFEVGGNTNGLRLDLMRQSASSDTGRLVLSAGESGGASGTAFGDVEVPFELGATYQFAVAVDQDSNSVRVWWDEKVDRAPEMRTGDLVLELPWDGTTWAGGSALGVGRIAGSAYGPHSSISFDGTVTLDFWDHAALDIY